MIIDCSGNVRNILAYVKRKIEVRTAEGEIVDLEVMYMHMVWDHSDGGISSV